MKHVSCLAICLISTFVWTGCSSSKADKPKIGFVLHGVSDFTATIQQGAEDAARDNGIDIEVVGPPGWKTADAIGLFEGMANKKVDGLVVIPFPGEMWVTPINKAIAAKIPVLTTNVSSPESDSPAWFGIDEFAGGETLAKEVRRVLEKDGKRDGRIVIGMCKPGLSVLMDRYNGFKKGMEGTKYEITDPQDVDLDPIKNFGKWKNLVRLRNENVVAYIMASAHDGFAEYGQAERGKADHLLVGRLRLGRTNHQGDQVRIDSGCDWPASVFARLFARAQLNGLKATCKDKKPLPRGWIPLEAELITPDNLDDARFKRETDTAAQTKWYADYIKKNFADITPLIKPLPGKKD